MIIDNVEYEHILKITDLNLAMYISQFEDWKYFHRLIGDINYKDKEHKKFESMNYFINLNNDDEIIQLIYQWEWEKYFEENKEKLFEKFINSESKNFFNMNMENFENKYFNEENIMDIDEEVEKILMIKYCEKQNNEGEN